MDKLTIEEDPTTVFSILMVKCAYCGRLFAPHMQAVQNRLQALIGKQKGEARLYCSDECKSACPVYYQKTGYEDPFYNPFALKDYVRYDQSQLREMALDLYGKECEICGETENLICHHIDPVKCNPIESLDLDNVVILCEDCHEESHKLPKCGKSYLAHVQ